MYDNPSTQADPKTLGAFYTPATIAGLLAGWVVQTGTERLLEPSVGEGALVEAAIARAKALKAGRSALKFLVCDVDAAAVKATREKVAPGSEARLIDFLDLEVGETGSFQGVIANPPFTRNHSIPRIRRAELRSKFRVSGAAGLWVHFLLHSIEFLEQGGRLAAVVPASALFTRYGQDALTRIAARFQTVEIHQIVGKPLWVNGAEERGAVILAAGFEQGTSALPQARPWSELNLAPEAGDVEGAAFHRLVQASIALGALGVLRIGAVTGCNDVFLLSEAERSACGIAREDVRPIVSRSRHVPGLKTSSADLLKLAVQGEKTWLLQPSSLADRGSAVRRRLATISARRRRRTVWFSKRRPWWRVQTSDGCDAIFTYMNDQGPRLVLAADDDLCTTNTLHEVRFACFVSANQKLACALSMISTFGQLAAERAGRSYGGGLLKFELGEARKLPILSAGNDSLDAVFQEADQELMRGDFQAAQTLADEALLAPILGSCWTDAVAEMTNELARRRNLRLGRRG